MTPDLPQMRGPLFLTDSGMETTLIFHEGRELPCFAAFVLHDDAGGEDWLAAYYDRHAALAVEHGAGFLFESNTWRASADWGATLGYDAAMLADVNRRAVRFVKAAARRWAGTMPVAVSGCIGPRGDGYDPGAAMTAAEAAEFHGPQAAALAAERPHLVTAITMTSAAEGAGVARAAAAVGLPAAISFTVETDGRLPTGQTLPDAIAEVDACGARPAYYMINCAHPTHFAHLFAGRPAWAARIGGVRANASRLSHGELDAMTELDAGDPLELAAHYAALRRLLPGLRVIGGCCGTDHAHVAAAARLCAHRAHA